MTRCLVIESLNLDELAMPEGYPKDPKENSRQ
jgi:hypothetical protein